MLPSNPYAHHSTCACVCAGGGGGQEAVQATSAKSTDTPHRALAIILTVHHESPRCIISHPGALLVTAPCLPPSAMIISALVSTARPPQHPPKLPRSQHRCYSLQPLLQFTGLQQRGGARAWHAHR